MCVFVCVYVRERERERERKREREKERERERERERKREREKEREREDLLHGDDPLIFGLAREIQCSSWVMETTPFLVLIVRERYREEGEIEKERHWTDGLYIERNLAFSKISTFINVLPFLKTVGSLAKASRVTFCLGCLSWVMDRVREIQ